VEVKKSLERYRVALQPGAYLVDIFPFLQYLPWYGRELRQGHIEDHSLFQRQLDAVKLQMVLSFFLHLVNQILMAYVSTEKPRCRPFLWKIPP
jgi:hypothetical protein